MMRFMRMAVIVIALVGLLAACGGGKNNAEPANNSASAGNSGAESSSPAQESSEAPLPKGKLTVYVAFQEDHAVEAIKQFSADTGIEAEMIRMSAGEILAKIRAEKSNPQADIWYGGPADTFVAGMAEDLLEPYHSPAAEKIDDKFKDPDGYWTGVYMGAIGIASNQKFLDKAGMEAPRTWDDLLDPRLKGEVVMAHPGSSGTAYTALYSILKVFGGEEPGFEYLQKFHQQVQQYTSSGSAPGRMVGMGEAGVGVLFAHDIIKYQEEGYSDLVMTIPEDGTGYEVGAVAIIKGTKNPELAKRFIDWAVSPGAQEVGKRAQSFQSLTHPDAVGPELAIKLDEINLVDYDIVEAGSQRNRLIERWNKEINN